MCVGGGVVQYFVLCQNQQQHKTREGSNYSTLSQRFESIYSAMKLLAPGLMQISDYICYKLYVNHHSARGMFHFFLALSYLTL